MIYITRCKSINILWPNTTPVFTALNLKKVSKPWMAIPVDNIGIFGYVWVTNHVTLST